MNRLSVFIVLLSFYLGLASCPHPGAGAPLLDRTYPRIFQAWNDIENLDSEDYLTRVSRHNLMWGSVSNALGLQWKTAETHPHQGVATELDSSRFAAAIDRLNTIRSHNPHTLLLCEIYYHDAKAVAAENETANIWQNGWFEENSPNWLRDGNGKRVIAWGEDTNNDGVVDDNDTILQYFIDFRIEDVQNTIASKALALKNSGMFDGIFLDWWREPIQGSSTRSMMTVAEEWSARESILIKIRGVVGDDFLIIVNANNRTMPLSVRHINGIFMECMKASWNESYTLGEIFQIENTLIWAESTASALKYNCLEGWRKVYDLDGDKPTRVAERNTLENLQMMRLFTAMSLTLSDGYVLFKDDNREPTGDHLHNWYPMWDVSLGNPVSPKTVNYSGIPGVYIREFEKGWAVYNRSGSTQHLFFAAPVTGFTSGIKGTGQDIQDMDGEIYLK